ncbi:primosomal protein N' [Arthrobacter sp. ISL-30]|uniref:primosomal protein N' n=1 Tax=Arthrobacter sp. ISL-30 TaxID=2819109 RepID=UPI001BEA08D7|nr:primosomal protein N' [Arthrobacter sp. ISL-30]MBT2512735.1 primosomal protein N' [Arthrobacter sp. ISL-30]
MAAMDPAVQPSLLQGFPAPAQGRSGPRLAAVNPVASVVVESPLPHLDRPFDYSVPADLAETALPGARVKVRFNGQELGGFILERLPESTGDHALAPLYKVVSPVQVLSPGVLELSRRVAARYAGTLSDVLRAAVPPRVARLEKEFLAKDAPTDTPKDAPTDTPKDAPTDAPETNPGAFSSWDSLTNGRSYLQHLSSGGSPRAALTALRGYGPEGWPALIATAVAAVRASGRGAVVVVPDYRDLDRMEKALTDVLPESDVARLTAEDGPTPRYRSFLRLLEGTARVAVGTRSAAFAPVVDLGLVACWDDGDDLHIDQRAPYVHSREVLLLRAEQDGAACLLAGHSRSTEVQRLVESGWAVPVVAERPTVRSRVPRVVNTADSFEQERDPLARMARLPGAAWRAAQEGLERGPVLVQVARAGYAPSLVCENCREAARCNHCQGPLAVSGPNSSNLNPSNLKPASIPQCRWCSTPAPEWRCSHCGAGRLRRGAAGVLRTAEELGRAFPGRTVVTSSGDHVKAAVSDAKALVVATVGAEPVADGGYAAALLLDGNSLLRRENLRAGEDTVRRWFNAAALVRPAPEGGLVVVTADDQPATGALVRWDTPGFAARELALRQELQLPPAVRIASITGHRADVEHFTAALAGLGLRSVGPAPMMQSFAAKPGGGGDPGTAASGGGTESRTLLFIPYARAAEATRTMRAVKAATAARRTAGPVQLRLDGVDVL